MNPETRFAAWFRRLTPYVALAAAAALALMFVLSLTSCEPGVGRPAVSLSIAHSKQSPRDAAVLIDEEYIGPLGYIAARGVRLPIGKHRITVEKPGYFPWDRLVEADREPIELNVELVPIPD
ncbi:MAG TPA: PEGA domain-containing protein [Polyangiaceae bacterium]